MGISTNKAIECYFMCGKNVEMAVQYYFEVREQPLAPRGRLACTNVLVVRLVHLFASCVLRSIEPRRFRRLDRPEFEIQ